MKKLQVREVINFQEKFLKFNILSKRLKIDLECHKKLRSHLLNQQLCQSCRSWIISLAHPCNFLIQNCFEAYLLLFKTNKVLNIGKKLFCFSIN